MSRSPWHFYIYLLTSFLIPSACDFDPLPVSCSRHIFLQIFSAGIWQLLTGRSIRGETFCDFYISVQLEEQVLRVSPAPPVTQVVSSFPLHFPVTGAAGSEILEQGRYGLLFTEMPWAQQHPATCWDVPTEGLWDNPGLLSATRRC